MFFPWMDQNWTISGDNLVAHEAAEKAGSVLI